MPRSVTGFLHAYADQFDGQEAIAAMQTSPHWETRKTKYQTEDGEVKSAEEIMADWEFNGAVQRARGTLLHYHCEEFLNGSEIQEPYSPEFAQFLLIYDTIFSKGWEIFRTEFCMYSSKLDLAGSAASPTTHESRPVPEGPPPL